MSGAGGTFVEVGHCQARKDGQTAEGDAFLSQKCGEGGRVITVLSDGLGSGVKACVLSTLTATMALKFVAADMPIKRAAGIIMSTLPVCKQRGISYATFTLVDVSPDAQVRVMEYDNPPFVLARDGLAFEPERQRIPFERRRARGAPDRESTLRYSEYRARPGDRLVFFSDGVTQSGMGSRPFPLGWGIDNARRFVLSRIALDPLVSARDLARAIVEESRLHDGYRAKDDITCGVIYFREPRDLLVVTGPPMNPDRDAEMGRVFRAFPGKKILSGGTTAGILARDLGVPVKLNLARIDPFVPPTATMEGADLVTEGIITLGRVAEILDQGSLHAGDILEGEGDNGARGIIELMLDSDRISFLVGTRINESHQDPNIPVELEMRRNVVRKIATLLSERYLKEVSVKFI